MFEGIEGFTFEGEKKTIQIMAGISIEELKQKIHRKFKLVPNQLVSSLTGRYLTNRDLNRYNGFQICDDEDVACMINAFEKQSSMTMLEIYAEIDWVGSSRMGEQHNFMNCEVDINQSDDDDPDYNAPAMWENSEDDSEFDEGDIPNGSEDDTDIDSDFDSIHSVPASPIYVAPSMVTAVVDEIQQGAGASVNAFQNSSPYYSYINWNYADQEIDHSEMEIPSSWKVGDALYVGLQFETKEEVQMAVKHYSMKMHQTFVSVESTPTLLNVRCRNYSGGCPWRMRAILSRKSNNWTVTKWGGRHTCVNPTLSQDHNKLDSEFICSCILGMVNQDPSVSIALIQERITSQFGYNVSYRKAWKAKQKAIVRVFGDWDESFAMLPRWLEYMMQFAPGSFYKLETIDYIIGNRVDQRFRTFSRVFWTFGQCSVAFNYCKPIIQIDGTHLYGKYRGTLLIATTQDGNNCVLPLAFAIVEGETERAWSWFLALIRLHVTQKQGICLISDRHASIKSAVSNPHLGWQPPNAYHVYCIRHIASNFNHRFKNQKFKQELLKLGYATSRHVFDQKLQKFRETSSDVARWIDSISKEKWSLTYDKEGRRYGHMTTNLSEAVNKVFKGARNMPITTLVRCTYTRLAEYFVQRGSQAIAEMNNGQRYCTKLINTIQKNQEEACSHQVRRYDIQSTLFEVEEAFNPVTQRGGNRWTVNLSERKCECGKFQLYKYPCSHVIAACVSRGLDFYQFVDPVYTMHNIVNAYSAQWQPIGNDHSIPESLGWKLLPDYTTLRKKGRPKSTRIRNEMDWVETQPRQRCRVCREVGHNRRHCPRQNTN